MKVISLCAATLLMVNPISAFAESFIGKVSSKQSASIYTINVDGQSLKTQFSQPIDLNQGQYVFFDGVKNGNTINVDDFTTVGVIRGPY